MAASSARESIVAIGLGVGLVTLVYVALPPIPDGPLFEGAGAADEHPTYGGTFVFHHESDIRGLDPQVSYDEISGMALKLLFEGLIDYDYDLEFVPRLAEALPDISDDGLVMGPPLSDYQRILVGTPERK